MNIKIVDNFLKTNDLDFFSKYLDAYRAEGIEIWGLTVENEP